MSLGLEKKNKRNEGLQKLAADRERTLGSPRPAAVRLRCPLFS